MKNSRRVVVTGMGVLSPYGTGVDTLWENIKAGKSCIGYFKSIDADKHEVKIGGEIADFDTSYLGDPKKIKRYSKPVLMALAGADEAIKNSGLDLEKEDLTRIGVLIGTGVGGLRVIEDSHKVMLNRGYNKCSPYTIPMMITNMPAGVVSIHYGLKGINKCICTACASSTHSIGDSFRSIQYGDADVMVAGGVEAGVCDFAIGGFTSARTLSKRSDDPQKVSRPYDKDRDGFVISEGAGILVLEELEHALKRNAKIYAEVLGYAQNSDAYDIVSPNPEGEGAAMVMELAMKDAQVEKKEISYINTHGTSTHVGDIAESKAIAKVFGDKNENKTLLVSSTKSMTGHALGAAGAIEAIISINALNEGVVPPTINLENQDEEVANLDYVPNKAREHEIDKVMSNSFGFGGCNSVLVFGKLK